jgi:glucokinase
MAPINKTIRIGFDLGGTKMMAVALNSNYQIIGRERKKTRAQDEYVVSVERILSVIKSTLLQADADAATVSGIGIAVPGTLDLSKGVILEAPNLNWKNVALKELIEREFKCPVTICNDVDAGVFGEFSFGAGQKAYSMLGVFPGTGIGAGLVYNGTLFTGKNNSCMEIGHFPVVQEGNKCGCGRYGCLETVASRLAISAQAAIAVFRGDAPNLQKICGSDIRDIKSRTLAQAIEQGDKSIEEIVRQAAYRLGITIGGVVNLLSPEMIVLGGGLVEAMPDLYVSEVNKALEVSVMPSLIQLTKVTAAVLADDAAALGAAKWSEMTASLQKGKK